MAHIDRASSGTVSPDRPRSRFLGVLSFRRRAPILWRRFGFNCIRYNGKKRQQEFLSVILIHSRSKVGHQVPCNSQIRDRSEPDRFSDWQFRIAIQEIFEPLEGSRFNVFLDVRKFGVGFASAPRRVHEILPQCDECRMIGMMRIGDPKIGQPLLSLFRLETGDSFDFVEEFRERSFSRRDFIFHCAIPQSIGGRPEDDDIGVRVWLGLSRWIFGADQSCETDQRPKLAQVDARRVNIQLDGRELGALPGKLKIIQPEAFRSRDAEPGTT